MNSFVLNLLALLCFTVTTIMVTILTLDFMTLGNSWYIGHLMIYVTFVLAMVGSFLTLLWIRYD